MPHIILVIQSSKLIGHSFCFILGFFFLFFICFYINWKPRKEGLCQPTRFLAGTPENLYSRTSNEEGQASQSASNQFNC